MTEESQTVSQAGSDASDGTLLQSGEVNYKGKEHRLHLTPKGLRLVASNDQSNAAGLPVIDVEWVDVLCACEAPKKKSTQDTADNAFVIHYIHRKADYKLCCKNVTLKTKQDSTQPWISQIMEKCKEGKPHKLLIVINPIGGKGTAPQTFEKHVRPIFDLAGVELIVKVTERAKHAVEIAKTCDVSSVDGVISMGGDGLYMEVLNGLTVQKQEEEGINFNDPDAKLVPPTVPIGFIPAGTGNGMANMFNGTFDVETAVLNIIRGETGLVNIFSTFEPGKLIQYAGLLLGNGYFGAMMQRTDDLRWMRRARYPYALLESIASKKKVMGLNIEVLKQDSKKMRDDSGNDAGASVSGWTKLGTKHLTAMMAFPAKILAGEGEEMKTAEFNSSFDLFLVKKGSRWDDIKLLVSLIKRTMSDLDHVEAISDIVGARLEFVGQEQDEGNTRQQEELLELSKMLDVDGEIFKLSVPKLEIRFHPHFLQVYCIPALIGTKTKEEP